MNLRILLIAALISQAMMSSGGPIVRPADCPTIDISTCSTAMSCCGSASVAPCADHRAPSSPPDPDDCRAICCYVCLFLDSTPAIAPTPPEKRFAGPASDTQAGEPSFPILTGAVAGTLGHTIRPPPPGASLRRAILCCWTT